MKPVRFLGDSLKRRREFPEDVRQDAGYQLEKVQRGEQPADFKPMPAIGKGVEGLRIWDESGDLPCDLHRTPGGLCGCLARVPEEDPGDESTGC